MNEEKDWKNRICPYLGQITDPETAISYPSRMNHCTHAKPMAAIDLLYQEEFCLTRKYADCEEFSAEPEAPLPTGLHATSRRSPHTKQSNGRWLWALLLLAAGILLVWLLLSRGIAFGGSNGNPTAIPEISFETPTTSRPSDLPTTATHLPTLKPTQASTPTPRPALGLEIPLGIDLHFIIHQIQEGDSLSLIAQKHGTTVEALRRCNYQLPSPLLTGALIVVPENFVDTQDYPAFEVYPVTEAMPLQDLATQLSVDLAQLKYYNGLSENFVPQAGDYLLIPRTVTPTPTPTP